MILCVCRIHFPSYNDRILRFSLPVERRMGTMLHISMPCEPRCLSNNWREWKDSEVAASSQFSTVTTNCKKCKQRAPKNVKVRKEKLGDRIGTLQQLVSPFEKSDTATVLHEAVGYIKFLHDQIQVLSSAYLQQNVSILYLIIYIVRFSLTQIALIFSLKNLVKF